MTEKTSKKLVLLVILLSFVSAAAYFVWRPDKIAEYALVIDAGSSGSRIHLYKWLPEDDDRIPIIAEMSLDRKCDETKPGLSKLAEKDDSDDVERGVRESLGLLITCARLELTDQIEDFQRVRLYLMATAGMRLLDSDDEQRIMEEVRDYLQDAPFDYRDASTIRAKEEALYAWVAANYLNGSLGEASEKPTIGILELGGASGQIAFVPRRPTSEDTELVLIAGSKYRVYARGFDGVGKTEITKTLKTEKSCFPINHEGSGVGNLGACREWINEYLETTDEIVFQRLRETMPPGRDVKFLAISNYYYTPSFFGQKSVLDYDKLKGAGSDYCAKKWGIILEEYSNVPPKFLSGHCLMAAYIPALLEDGFHVEDDDGRVMLRLGGSEASIDWTLGALILLLH